MALFRSTLSTPTPARPTTLRRPLAASNTSFVTCEQPFAPKVNLDTAFCHMHALYGVSLSRATCLHALLAEDSVRLMDACYGSM